MKANKTKTGMLVLLTAVLIPMSIFSQQEDVKIMVRNEGVDSTLKNRFFSTTFDVEDLGEMHRKLDSVFSTFDADLEKKIKVMAFSTDSMFNGFNFNGDFDFKHTMDSMFSFHKFSIDDNRVEKLLDGYHRKPGKQGWVFDDNNIALLRQKGMDVEVKTDSITENGKTVIRKKMIVKGSGDGKPIVIERFDALGGKEQELIAYSDSEAFTHPGKHIIIEHNDKRFKPSTLGHNHVKEISLADAEILIKGGVSPKVITAPALEPKNIEVQIKVKKEYGKEIKTIGMSMDFEDRKDLQVIILARDGQVVSDETLKKFTGTYSKAIEINEAISPYFFVVIRDKKMFGRLIQE